MEVSGSDGVSRLLADVMSSYRIEYFTGLDWRDEAIFWRSLVLWECSILSAGKPFRLSILEILLMLVLHSGCLDPGMLCM